MSRPVPVPIDERGPSLLDLDGAGRCWWGGPAVDDVTGDRYPASWTLSAEPYDTDTHWLAHDALPVVHRLADDRDEPCSWSNHPSLTAAERNPSLCR